MASIDWVAAFIDEEQQVSDEAVADVIARGRDAPDGWYPILSTCTISDDPGFRSRLANYKTDPSIDVHALQVTANPFMPPEFIEQMKSSMTPRQFRMRVLAQEEPPERATYPDFDRRRHVRPVPQIGAVDITQQLTGGRVLIGYDPGALCDVSVLLKAFRVGDSAQPYWWIVDEVVTRPGNPNKHANDLARHLWRQYKLKPDDVVIRADPHVSGEHGATDDTYAEVRLSGFSVQYAVYKKNAPAAQAHRHGQLPKDARIQVVNTLLLNARDETRLFLDTDDMGRPRAQFTATSLEMSQRDDFGRAEMYKKGSDNDISHPTCALGYAIYRLEKARTSPTAVRVRQ